MSFVAFFQNPDGSKKKATLGKKANKLYIALDLNKDGSNGDDAKRDIIKFTNPKIAEIVLSDEAKKTIVSDEGRANWIQTYKDRATKILKLEKDLLSPMGWKGLMGNDIKDALEKVKQYLGNDKVSVIILSTHGAVLEETEDSCIIFDNNSKRDDNYICPDDFHEYESNSPSLGSAQKVAIESLKGIVEFVEDDGQFVMASCHSAYNDKILSSLQFITHSKVNMYGIYGISHATYVFDQRIVVFYNNGAPTYTHDEVYNGTAYISAKQFSNVSILDEYPNNHVRHFPTGWQNGDVSVRLSDLLLTPEGFKTLP